MIGRLKVALGSGLFGNGLSGMVPKFHRGSTQPLIRRRYRNPPRKTFKSKMAACSGEMKN
jgi:hypothetical protein